MPVSIRFTLSFGLALALMLAGCGGNAPEPDSQEEPDAVSQAPAPDPAPAAPVAEAPTPAAVVDWLIVPGERVGPITPTSSAADLIAVYGAENVRDEPYPLGEGETEPGTAIFPGDPTRRVLILWNDLDKKALPLAARIDGAGSQWKTAEGLAVGTSLKRVEELNGKPFLLYGFGWDYGGQLVDSNGGALKDLPHEDPEGGFRGGALLLTFQPDAGADDSTVLGDSTFSSDLPAMQSVDPKVSMIIVSFPDAG
ncbi:MAG: hypothetical protein JNK74_18065 [Candidatus Hydrogenedentes bacterium]|nr:hypothetical protein [Candidatus Hydrogenedentota bacterium]